jgi:voltage-gated potassium channel
MRRELKTGIYVLFTMVLVLVAGTVGYMIIEQATVLNALYMTVITITTVGFKEVFDLSDAGKVFTLLLILGGVGTILYGLRLLVEFVVKGQLTGIFRRRAVKRQVDKLQNHYIICGYGRVGRAVARHLATQKARFVVIDAEPTSLARAESDGFLVVEGDATRDEVLEEAGIARANGLVAAVGSDADNIYVTLSSRVLNPSLFVVARADSEDAASKLQRAGADRVVSPYGIGGKQMATMMLKPLVSEYLELVTGSGKLEFRVEELQLGERCCAVGRSIEDLAVRRRTGASILAVRRSGTGSVDTNPSAEVLLEVGDTIIAIGTPAEITKLEDLIRVSDSPSRQEA